MKPQITGCVALVGLYLLASYFRVDGAEWALVAALAVLWTTWSREQR